MAEFQRQFTQEDEVPAEDGPLQVRPFEMEDFSSETTPQKRSFSFDNEIQRNFDPTTVNQAREGVQEIFRDAMERIKEQAVKIKGEARQDGYDQGYQDGFKAGEEAAKTEFAPFLETLQRLVEDLSAFRRKMYPKVEREMVHMITELAKKVIHSELQSREDSIQDVIRLAVSSVLDRETMTIKVNPADKLYAESYRPELHQLFTEIKNITIEAQPAVQRGGCVITTNFGTVDAQVSNLGEQIDRILQMAPPPLPEEPEPELPPAGEPPAPEPPPGA